MISTQSNNKVEINNEALNRKDERHTMQTTFLSFWIIKEIKTVITDS